MNIIEVNNLSKEYSYKKKDKSKGIFSSEVLSVKAVNNISFKVKKGETIAFIGPNGAGKSTTIKMLTGILFPTSGSVKICGLTPIQDRNDLSYKVGTVFGQRSQLLPNLPLTDSLEMFGVMYDMSKKQIEKRINELVELFDLKDFINQPVRKLSLGQRMRAEIAASLIHNPEIIFLDEPTIGLDVVSKKNLRDLLKKINEEQGTTIFLTSHDTEDIESICERCIIINHGDIIIDLPTSKLIKEYMTSKKIGIIPINEIKQFPKLIDGLSYALKEKNHVEIEVDNEKISTKDAMQFIIDKFDIDDIDIQNESLESIIRGIYEED